jgi:tetraacyldisaccharide 4'-kinase
MTLAARLEAIWYGPQRPGWPLRVLAVLYGAVIAARRWLYRLGVLRSHRLAAPVVVVGNRVAGGTGKTPLVLALVEHFSRQGYRPGVVSRGYGRRGQDLVRVRADTEVSIAGDEPALIARSSGVPVAVCANRVRAARALIAEGCDLIIADDGLQHLALGRDLEIEVVDAQRGYGNGLLLPAGPLREQPPEAFTGLRVINGGAGDAGGWPMRLRPGLLHPLDGGPPQPLSALGNTRVHAVAGIGNPERFFATLREHGLEVIEHRFVDHHAFTSADFEYGFEGAGAIVMTGKDAVKCRGIAPAGSYWLDTSAELPELFFIEVEHRLKGRGDGG